MNLKGLRVYQENVLSWLSPDAFLADVYRAFVVQLTAIRDDLTSHPPRDPATRVRRAATTLTLLETALDRADTVFSEAMDALYLYLRAGLERAVRYGHAHELDDLIAIVERLRVAWSRTAKEPSSPRVSSRLARMRYSER